MTLFLLTRERPDGEEHMIVVAETDKSAIAFAEYDTRKSGWKVSKESPVKPGVFHFWVRR